MLTLNECLGRTIRRLRTAAGYSQEGFADHIGVHRTAMGAIERGAGGGPRLATIVRIAQALEVAASELLREAEREASTQGSVAKKR